MGRLTDAMMRLVGEIQAGREERGRLLRDLQEARLETKRDVARLRRTLASDLAGARLAWCGAAAPALSGAIQERATPAARERQREAEAAPERGHAGRGDTPGVRRAKGRRPR